MAYFYLDIETFGNGIPNPATDKIISIQFQEISPQGTPLTALSILKEWETSEEEILRQFVPRLKPWEFIPVGNNLNYERKFLKAKCLQHNIPFDVYEFTYNAPSIDIQPLFVMLNNGKFKGCGMHNFTSKKTSGEVILHWYKNKEFEKIENYIVEEAAAFLEFYQTCFKQLPNLLLKQNNSQVTPAQV